MNVPALDVFPAGAGMIRLWTVSLVDGMRVPRRRGDDPVVGENVGYTKSCSPQARG